MEYHQIRYFLKAAECENFSKAARELYISPQSIAKQIALLEKELNVRLFDRVGRNVALNSNGKYVYEKFQEVDRVFVDAVQDIERHIQDLNDRVRICFFSALPRKKMLSPMIGALLSRFPEYRLEFRMLPMNEAIGQLLDRKADIVITNIEENDEVEGISRIVFWKTPAQIIVAPGHPWWGREEVTLEEMAQMDIIKIQGGRRLDENRTKLGLYERLLCRKVIGVPNFETMYTLLEQGKAFAVVPNAFANAGGVDFHFINLPLEERNFDTAGKSGPWKNKGGFRGGCLQSLVVNSRFFDAFFAAESVLWFCYPEKKMRQHRGPFTV